MYVFHPHTDNIPESVFSEVLGRYFVDVFCEYFLCSLWLNVRLIRYQLQQTQLNNHQSVIRLGILVSHHISRRVGITIP